MARIRALIVDDEPLAREGIHKRLELEPDIEVICECRNGREAVAAILREAPDLVFLDIQMPRLDGFGVVETVGVRQMPQVIFVTAYDEHALRAFDVHAIDYLLKPIDSARFDEALQRVRIRLRVNSVEALGEQLRQMLAALRVGKKPLERLAIKLAGRIIFLNVEEVDWIEAADNYVRVHAGHESHLVHATMNSLESRLDANQFLRIHRSIIVQLKRVKELQPMFHGEYRVILKDGTQLSSGRGYREKLQILLNDL